MFEVSMALAEAWEPGKTIPVQASYGFPEKCPDSLKPDSATESGCSKARVKWSYMTTKHSKKKKKKTVKTSHSLAGNNHSSRMNQVREESEYSTII